MSKVGIFGVLLPQAITRDVTKRVVEVFQSGKLPEGVPTAYSVTLRGERQTEIAVVLGATATVRVINVGLGEDIVAETTFTAESQPPGGQLVGRVLSILTPEKGIEHFAEQLRIRNFRPIDPKQINRTAPAKQSQDEVGKLTEADKLSEAAERTDEVSLPPEAEQMLTAAADDENLPSDPATAESPATEAEAPKPAANPAGGKKNKGKKKS